MNDHIFNQKLRERVLVEEVFINSRGSNDVQSVSISPSNSNGQNFIQVPAGTILGKNVGVGMFFPMAVEAATADSVTNDVVVAESLAFLVGDYVEINGTYRKITKVDYETDTLTVSGPALSVTVGDLVTCDRSRGLSEVKTTAGAGTVIAVENAEQFAVGNIVKIDTTSSLTVTAVDPVAGTITISAATAVTAGHIVSSNQSNRYLISTRTISTEGMGFIPQNTLVPTRIHGRVKEANLRGLTDTAKSSLGGIDFDQRTL